MKIFKNKAKVAIALMLSTCLFLGEQVQTQASTIGPAKTYSGSGAASYAQKYAINPNTSYHKWSSDCTNFVSQCAYEGGGAYGYPDPSNYTAKSGGKVISTSKYWYYIGNSSKYICSTTWMRCSNSNAFYHYWNKCIVGTFTSLSNVRKNAQVGDVIQICYSDGSIKHSIICVSKDTSDIYCASHTSNYKKDSLTAINKRATSSWGSGLKYCIYHLKN